MSAEAHVIHEVIHVFTQEFIEAYLGSSSDEPSSSQD